MLCEVYIFSRDNLEQNEFRPTLKYYAKFFLQEQSWRVGVKPSGIDAVKSRRS
jgi:hypothetical protein